MLNNKEVNQPVSKPSLRIEIIVDDKGKMSVVGFPTNYHIAIDIMIGASKAVTSHFMAKAVNGEIDQLGNIVESKIIRPDKNIIVPSLN